MRGECPPPKAPVYDLRGSATAPQVLLPKKIVEGPYGEITFEALPVPYFVTDPEHLTYEPVVKAQKAFSEFKKKPENPFKLYMIASSLALPEEQPWKVRNAFRSIRNLVSARLFELGNWIMKDEAEKALDDLACAFDSTALLFKGKVLPRAVINLAISYLQCLDIENKRFVENPFESPDLKKILTERLKEKEPPKDHFLSWSLYMASNDKESLAYYKRD
jgi:hypothetical protein